MCDQTEVSYLEDDVVWVKIGPIWWPGIVKDLEKDEEGREILAGLKKKPIAAVKFFQEDNYEFVKNLDHIYHYNCRRKDEFIKKGLDKFRAGAPHMKKFPADVTTAETLVHGDVNIVNDPKYFPEKRQSYSEIFGTGKKKSKKDTDTHPRPRAHSSVSNSPYRPITHQRFINKVLHGESDHKVRTLIQPAPSPDDISNGTYKCHVCKFQTSRVNVIVAHHRLAHSSKNSINWTGSDVKTVRRKTVYKSRKSKPKRLLESPADDSSDEEPLEKKKLRVGTETVKIQNKTRGSSSTPKKKKESDNVLDDSQKRPRFTDVLLADWGEEDEDEKKTAEPGENREENEDQSDNNDKSVDKPADSVDPGVKDDHLADEKEKNQNEKMSCFDFDEEEEGFIGMNNANTYGRKIPRVIPLKDKSELGVDLEISELFKRKNDTNLDSTKDELSLLGDEQKSIEDETDENSTPVDSEVKTKVEDERDKVSEKQKEEKPEKLVRRKRKSSKEQEIKADEDSLAVRRTRRPGAKKSYLNEVIEKIEENSSVTEEKTEESMETNFKNTEVPPRKTAKEDMPTSSSRRKQDLKLQTMDKDLEDTIYTDIVKNDVKSIETSDSSDKKAKGKQTKNVPNDDLTQKIDNLLAETNIPILPEIPGTTGTIAENFTKSPEISKSSSTLNFSFDYVTPETGERNKTEMKSITKMFSETVKEIEEKEQPSEETLEESCDASTSNKDIELAEANPDETQTGGNKVTSSQVSTAMRPQITVFPSNDQTASLVFDKEGKNINDPKTEALDNISDGSENASKMKNIKTLKLKADSLPTSLLSTAGKLKGQTIIHQKGGTYVILSQPQHLPRQKISAKGQTSGKLVIFTNQLGEQKIITTSGLQQSKFKIEPQKITVASSTSNISEPGTSSTIVPIKKTQPVIKMFPDGKGGVMKQLTVSPKKVLVGGTKVLVSGAGTTFSTQGSNVQKISLSGGNNLSGDYRLIENYKGTGKTLLIQGGSNTSTGVLLKTGTSVQRHGMGDTIQNSSNLLNVKKKPNIIMRATPNQNEYVVHSEITAVDSPTYVMKRKGVDGKFSQNIFRRPVITQTKAKPSSAGPKAFILSTDQSAQKNESLIIKTNHEPSQSKIIRITQKVREQNVKPKFAQKIIQKLPESFTVSENNMLTSVAAEEPEISSETPQIVQVAQNTTQQPVLQTQVMAMPGPIGSDGNQTYVLVSVDEHGVVQPVDNSLITYDTSGPTESVFMNTGTNNNVIVINSQTSEEIKPVFSNGSQDILAEALANTNVLEGNMNNEMESVMPSILLPPSIPSSVVQETSITLQKPIMTPLEMPTSVAPDTSGLEPPPLPPTPTDEDVLMEDQDAELRATEQIIHTENNSDMTSNKRECLTDKGLLSDHSFKIQNEDNHCQLNAEKEKDSVGVGCYEQSEDQTTCQDEYVTDNPLEEQGSTSLQSMPLLNDEPDTSDDAQASELILEQDFESQKSHPEAEEFSSIIREQEPPSSTNNEVTAESKKTTIYNSEFQPAGEEIRNNENEKSHEDSKVKETTEKDMQSMPVISDDGNVNAYAFGQVCVDALSQKRFQEETEVTSTTDEYSNKDNNTI